MGTFASFSRTHGGGLAAFVVVAMAGCGVLVEQNPKFSAGDELETGTGTSDTGEGTDGSESDESGTEGSGSGETTGDEDGDDDGLGACEEGLLDCDGELGCEASAADPATCGGCSHSCIVDGEVHSCFDGVCSGTVTLDASADLFVDEGANDQNFDGAAELEVSGAPPREVLITFDEVDLLPAGATVVGASLDLISIDPGAQIHVHRILEPWDPAALTWASRPTVAGSAAVWNPPVGAVSVAIDEIAEDWLVHGEPNYGITLRTMMDDGAVFRAIESGEGPVLNLDLTW